MDKGDLKKRGLIFNGFHVPYNPDLVDRARDMRINMTAAERKLWYEFLKKHKRRFRRQCPIDNYIVDFYCAALGLVIEIDGEQHHSDGGRKYDSERDAVLASYGLKILRFSNRDVMDNFEAICNKIDQLTA